MRRTAQGWSAFIVPLALLAGISCTNGGDIDDAPVAATTDVDDVAEEVADRAGDSSTTTLNDAVSSTSRVTTSPDGVVTAGGDTTASVPASVVGSTTSVSSSGSSASGSTTSVTTEALRENSSTSTTSAASVTTTVPPVSTIAAMLSSLVVASEPSRIGYDRDLFDHWADIDGNGCDARQDTLARQVIGFPQVDLFDRCVIVEGDWYSAYDAVSYAGSPSELDIDHVVALAEAWDSGASRWTDAQRRQFANDPSNLLAVTASSNRSKSDRDAGEWRPPARSSWCLTATITIEVKATYALSVDQAEAAALAEMIAACGGSDQYVPGMPPASTASATTTTTSPSSQPSNTTEEERSDCVDINSASLDELDRIVHIGPARAADIVALRPFASIADLTRVSGISDGRLAEIREQGLACVG